MDRDCIIKECCKEYELPFGLVKAIIQVESSNNQYAIRYEPRFRWITNLNGYSSGLQTKETEKQAQKTSWGLMQIMGGTARDLGFNGVFLSELLDVRTNVNWGCLYLAGLRERFSNLEDSIAIFDDNMIAAYNAGSPRRNDDGTFVNQAYVNKILRTWGV